MLQHAFCGEAVAQVTRTPFPSSKAWGNSLAESESHVLSRCLAGDADAFETIYQKHGTNVYNLAYRMVGNAPDAEDLLQEIFIQAWGKLRSFKGDSTFSTWLYRLSVNRCLDFLRSRPTRNRQATDPIEDHEAAPAARREQQTPTQLDLERAISSLPDSYRSAFILYDVHGFEHREVGRILGVAEGTSKSLVHKARMRLRQILATARQVEV